MIVLSDVSATLSGSLVFEFSLGSVLRLAVSLGMLVLVPAASYATAAALDEAAERYRSYLIQGIGDALTGVKDLRARVAAKDLGGAKRAWIAARGGWERSEVFTAGFVPELDRQIDSWPDATTGFHAIEAKLFGSGNLDVAAETGALANNLSNVQRQLRDIKLTPQGLFDGTVRLIYEVGDSKADGGESRVSGTSLDDIKNNVAGIRFAFHTIFAAALKSVDRSLADSVDAEIQGLTKLVEVDDLRRLDISALRRASEELVVVLQSAAPKIGLRRATLEEASR